MYVYDHSEDVGVKGLKLSWFLVEHHGVLEVLTMIQRGKLHDYKMIGSSLYAAFYNDEHFIEGHRYYLSFSELDSVVNSCSVVNELGRVVNSCSVKIACKFAFDEWCPPSLRYQVDDITDDTIKKVVAYDALKRTGVDTAKGIKSTRDIQATLRNAFDLCIRNADTRDEFNDELFMTEFYNEFNDYSDDNLARCDSDEEYASGDEDNIDYQVY